MRLRRRLRIAGLLIARLLIALRNWRPRRGVLRIAAGREIIIRVLCRRAQVGRDACLIKPNALIHAVTHIARLGSSASRNRNS